MSARSAPASRSALQLAADRLDLLEGGAAVLDDRQLTAQALELLVRGDVRGGDDVEAAAQVLQGGVLSASSLAQRLQLGCGVLPKAAKLVAEPVDRSRLLTRRIQIVA